MEHYRDGSPYRRLASRASGPDPVQRERMPSNKARSPRLLGPESYGAEPAAPANQLPGDDELWPIFQVSWKRNTRNLETPSLIERGYMGLFASPRMDATWCFSRGIRVSVIKGPNHDRL
ncbi:hypothetical protein U1Q18_038661 [Sarracenia purpurea var. burkii]